MPVTCANAAENDPVEICPDPGLAPVVAAAYGYHYI